MPDIASDIATVSSSAVSLGTPAMPTVLPSRSLGVVMPRSVRAMIEFSGTGTTAPTAFTGTPLDRAISSSGAYVMTRSFLPTAACIRLVVGSLGTDGSICTPSPTAIWSTMAVSIPAWSALGYQSSASDTCSVRVLVDVAPAESPPQPVRATGSASALRARAMERVNRGTAVPSDGVSWSRGGCPGASRAGRPTRRWPR